MLRSSIEDLDSFRNSKPESSYQEVLSLFFGQYSPEERISDAFTLIVFAKIEFQRIEKRIDPESVPSLPDKRIPHADLRLAVKASNFEVLVIGRFYPMNFGEPHRPRKVSLGN